MPTRCAVSQTDLRTRLALDFSSISTTRSEKHMGRLPRYHQMPLSGARGGMKTVRTTEEDCLLGTVTCLLDADNYHL